MQNLLSKFTLFFCFCLSIFLGLAIFGYFKKWLILGVLIIGFLVFLGLILHKKPRNFEKNDLFVIAGIFIFSLFLGFFHHDLPRGRDDASYMSAAIKLSETNSLVFEDKLTHSFTGFRNLEGDKFTSQFLPGYTVYLATFNNLGGIKAVFWANTLIIFLSFAFIYFAAKNLGGSKTATITLLFLFTFYTIFWFPRRLVSENLFMMLFWTGIFLFFEGWQKKTRLYFLLGLIPMTLTLFVRGEAIAFWIIYLLAVFFLLLKSSRNHINVYRNKIFISTIIFVIFNISFLVYYLKIYNGFNYFISQFSSPLIFFFSLLKFILPVFAILAVIFIILFISKKSTFKQIVNLLKNNFQKILFSIILAAIGFYELILLFQKNASWNFYQIQYGFKVFAFCFLIFYLFIILFGLYHKLYKKEEFILTLFVLPSFLFLLRSHIAQDLPWFLRRFYPVFIPFVFLMTAIIINRLEQKIFSPSLSFIKRGGANFRALVEIPIHKQKRIINGVVLFFVAINFIFSWPIIFFSENRNIKSQIENFSKQFKNEDLIVMTPGWDWQKWAYPLHYFYKLEVLPNLNSLYPTKNIISDAQKYKNELDDDEIILKIKKYFDEKSYAEFKKLAGEVNGDIYLLAEREDLIIYPYSGENLEFINNVVWKYDYLIPAPPATKYITKNSKNLDLIELNKKITEIPPQTKLKKELELKLYKVKNKDGFIFPERKYSDEDIENFRKDLKKWLG